MSISNTSQLPRFLDKPNVDYIKGQIETGDNEKTKRALQSLCKFYRQGFRIRPDQIVGVEQSIVGLLYTQKGNEKVRRWALNSLARIGREAACRDVVVEVLKTYSHEPQTTAAAIAAIYRLSRQAGDILKKLDFDEQMIALAALQHVDAGNLDLSALPLNVDNASSELLKLALILAGVDRAPPNALHPNHDNHVMVKVLGKHDDEVVAQYSVWAITENSSLSIKDLGIDVSLVESQPTNVRSWIFQLIGISSMYAQKNIEYVELGMRDPEAEARSGMATGLKRTFFDGIEVLMLDWYTREADPDTSQNVLDHMVHFFERCPSYEAMVLEVYEAESARSSLRQRIEATASGGKLFAKLKRISFNEDVDLFQESVAVNNTINIHGNVSGAAISGSGGADISGVNNAKYSERSGEKIISELSRAEAELHSLSHDSPEKREALSAISDAKIDTSTEKVAKAVASIRSVVSTLGGLLPKGAALVTIANAIAEVAGLK